MLIISFQEADMYFVKHTCWKTILFYFPSNPPIFRSR